MTATIALRPMAFALAFVLFAGCSGKPAVVEPAPATSAGGDEAPRSIRVFVVSHGWHAGLVIPSERMEAAIPDLKERFGVRKPPYYEIGWGDKGFYQAPQITSGLTLQAMFWSTGAILHVVAVPLPDPREYFDQSRVVETCLTENEATSLTTFIAGSFARDPEDRVERLGRGLYGDSEFYDAVGRYFILNTCNKWTAKGLRSAGMGISPEWRLTAGSVIGAIETHRKPCMSAFQR